MRYTLGLCAVLAAANPAWTAEYQAPAATAPRVTTTPVSPTLSNTSATGAYQTATGQPSTPTMTSPTTIPAGTQPTTTYATPMQGTTYVVNPYPTMTGAGTYSMMSPVYTYPAAPGMTTYGTPVQTYTAMPGQSYYQPVQRRFGLFQRRRQQVVPTYSPAPAYGSPMYGTPVSGFVPYGAPVYSTTGYQAATYTTPSYTTYSYGTPAAYPTSYTVPTTTAPHEQHGADERDGADHDTRLYAHDAQRPQFDSRFHHDSRRNGNRRASVPGERARVESGSNSCRGVPEPGGDSGADHSGPAAHSPDHPPLIASADFHSRDSHLDWSTSRSRCDPKQKRRHAGTPDRLRSAGKRPFTPTRPSRGRRAYRSPRARWPGWPTSAAWKSGVGAAV